MAVKSRIILVYPMQGMSGTYVRHAPLSLLYLSAEVLKRGFTVDILDTRLCPDTWTSRLHDLLGDDVLCVGISVMSGRPITGAIRMGQYVKSLRPDLPIVWGGPHATFYPDTILVGEPSADYVVSGYGIAAFATLCDHLRAGTQPAGVPGVWWRDGAEVRGEASTASFEYVEFEDIPYHLIPDYAPYGQLDQGYRIFSMYSAVGCPYKCSFCSSPAQYAPIPGKKWVPLDANRVVNHIEFLVNRYQANYIYFIDDDSFPSLKHVEGIIDEINRRGIRVKLGFRGARVNEVLRMSDEFLDKLAAAGTDIMHIGAESGSNRVLKMLRKDCTVEDIVAINRKLARHPQMIAAYNFMMGAPTETLEELKATRDLILQLVHDHPNCLIFPPNKFRPLPGTELYDIAKKEWGYQMPSSLAEWANIEVEGDISRTWYSKEFTQLCNLMLITAYFVDNKVARVTKGRTLFTRFARVLNTLYRPIALLRLRNGWTQVLVEYWAYRVLTRLLAPRQTLN